MKKLIAIVIVLAAFNIGCENKRFQYTVSIDQVGQFTIDDPDGVYFTSTFISRTSIARAFNLPEGARVKSLKIESLSLSASKGLGNVASALTVSAFLGRTATQTNELFRNVPILLSVLDIPQIGLNDLIESNIQKLQTELENFVKGVGTGTLVEFAASGTTTPAGSRLVLVLNMHITATVQYERCEEILQGMTDLPACSEAETGH